MLRFIRNLSIILCACSAHVAIAANNYQKSGAPVSLSKPVYQVTNNDAAQTILIELTTGAIGTMQLRFSSSPKVSIQDTPNISLQATSVSQTHKIPLTVTASANSKSYINIFVTFSDHNGAVTSRALSAILNSGQPPASKRSSAKPTVISMRAIETIKSNK